VTAAPAGGSERHDVEALTGIAGVTFDFGNTLVRVDRPSLRRVLAETADALVERGSVTDPGAFLAAWGMERDRQFRLQVPRLLEVDLAERVRHVLAGLRGASIPATDDQPWDEPAVAALTDADEVAFAVESYSLGFVAAMAPIPEADATLRAVHAAGFRLGVLSNWPLATTVDRYLEARGWAQLMDAVVVSQRVGVIKPHPAIFRAAEAAMALEPATLLHVGDDWAADVVGGCEAGWHVAYLRGHQGDTPLPTSSRAEADEPARQPDIEIDRLDELLGRVAAPARGGAFDRVASVRRP
jgi:HAD superfamily hydrolase (TIGR01509 family)